VEPELVHNWIQHAVIDGGLPSELNHFLDELLSTFARMTQQL
jgi:hypothetical protein